MSAIVRLVISEDDIVINNTTDDARLLARK